MEENNNLNNEINNNEVEVQQETIPNITEPVVEEVNTGNNEPEQKGKKGIIPIILIIVGLACIFIFYVYPNYINKPKKPETPNQEEKKEDTNKQSFDMAEAQKLVDRYKEGVVKNAKGCKYNDDPKEWTVGYTCTYKAVNESYKEIYGKDKEFKKKDFTNEWNAFEYNKKTDSFVGMGKNFGSPDTEYNLFDSIKDAYIENNQLIVEYYDCSIYYNGEEYSLLVPGLDPIKLKESDFMKDEEDEISPEYIKQVEEKYKDQMLKKYIFEKENDNYIIITDEIIY